MIRSLTCWCAVVGCSVSGWAAETEAPAFYVAENPAFTITDSAIASVRFTLGKTVRTDDRGHLVSVSSFVDPEGQVMGWHDFGHLEGPGWAANAVGGAHEIYRLGQFLQRPEWQQQALSILDHVLEADFIEQDTGLIRGYRETTTGKYCLNYKHDGSWFCPGSMAKIGFQLLCFADDLPGDPRAARMQAAAVGCARWLDQHLATVPNGWFPRRVTPAGEIYRQSPDGGDDPFWQTSADGLFILQLQAALTSRRAGRLSPVAATEIRRLRQPGGDFRQHQSRHVRCPGERGLFGRVPHAAADRHTAGRPVAAHVRVRALPAQDWIRSR